MIAHISSGPGIVVQGGGGHTNQIYLHASSAGNPASGSLRYNNAGFEVWDGSTWRQINQNYTNISLEPGMLEVIEWAAKKRSEERELAELAKQYPMLEDAMRDLEVIKVLVSGKKNHDIQQS